jgi:hypothetical protein
MVLATEECELFFKNWKKLLAYVNKEYNITQEFFNSENSVEEEPFYNKIGIRTYFESEMRNKLWENSNIIDKYIKETNLNDEDISIVNSWKRFIKGKFILIKKLKKYYVLLDGKKEILYGVNNFSNPFPFSEMLNSFPLIETVLIPFNGKIIYDSIIGHQYTQFERKNKKLFEEKYKEIKIEKGIIEVL